MHRNRRDVTYAHEQTIRMKLVRDDDHEATNAACVLLLKRLQLVNALLEDSSLIDAVGLQILLMDTTAQHSTTRGGSDKLGAFVAEQHASRDGVAVRKLERMT